MSARVHYVFFYCVAHDYYAQRASWLKTNGSDCFLCVRIELELETNQFLFLNDLLKSMSIIIIVVVVVASCSVTLRSFVKEM